jgi:hypothetical protein
VRAFVLTNRNLSGDEMAAIFVKALPKILRLAHKRGASFVATVNRTAVTVVKER